MVDVKTTSNANPILIIDDDIAQLKTLADILETEELQPICCQTGQEALQISRQQKINVSILDLRLPDIDGLELLKQLKAHNPDIKVIINTAYASLESAMEAINEEAFAYVRKMGDVDELLAYVHRAFRVHLAQYSEVLEKEVEKRTKELLNTNEQLRQEIAVRKRVEAELKAYREHLEQRVQERTAELEVAISTATHARDKIDAILHSVADGLIVTDLANKVILANPAAEALLGFRQEEMVEREIGLGIKDDRLREIVRDTLNRQKSGYEIDIELEDPRDHRQKVMRARTALVDDFRSQPLGTVTIIQDVTRLREVDRLKTEFLSTVAHELKTPLTSVQGFSEILLTRRLDEARRQRYLQMINRQATHLSEIINDLLSISRLEARRGLEIKPKLMTMGAMLDEVLVPFIETVTNHKIKVKAGQDLPAVMADPFRLSQVCRNLMSNAIKYSPQGGTITVRAQVCQDYLEISVEDEGIGMSPEQQAHLFEKFYRAYESNTSMSGTGLGLAICKLIVGLHGGQIWVESELNVGTTVYFTLPLATEYAIDFVE